MNGFRKLLRFVLTLAIGAFAMSASAAPGSPEKIFGISGIPTSATAGSTLTVTVTFKNETPNGNSTINSLRLIAPTGWTLSNPAAIAGGSVSGGTPTLAPDGASVSFDNMPGIRAGGKTWRMQVSVSVPASASCSNAWSAEAFTGNALGGDPFRLINSAASLNTNVNSGAGQATSFTMQPTNTTVGSAIPVSVGLTDTCGTGPAGTTVTITADNGCTTASGCLAGNTATTNSNGGASFTGLVINTPGTYTLTATPGASGFPTANSSLFTVYAGQIFCDDPLEALQANPNSLPFGTPGYAEGKRGKYNKDGSEPCVKVNYTFDNDILTDDRVHLSWDVNVQPYAAFSYTMFWKLRPVDADGWTSVRPDVAWDPDGNGQPIFVPGIACLSPTLPAPYGTLATAGGISASATTFAVSTTAALPAGVKFPIVIGTERMQVEAVSGATSPYTLTVTRGTGGTAAASHAFGDRVMSTPLPIYPASDPVYPNTMARVCVVEHGFTAAGTDADGTGLVGYFTTVIDIGDGWVRIGI